MTQDQVAQVIGVSRQHLNGLMRELGAAGLVQRRYGAIAVHGH